MKRFSVLLLTLSLLSSSAVPVQSAQAGITTAFTSAMIMNEDPAVGLLAGALSVGLIVGGVQMVNYQIPGGKYLGLALIVLDASQIESSHFQSEIQDGLVIQLSQMFPFIDQQECIQHLALLIHQELDSQNAWAQPKNIRLAEMSVRSALEEAGLSYEQVDFVVESLAR